MSLFKPKMDPAIKAKAERPGVLVFVSVPCVSGLPVPEYKRSGYRSYL